MERLKSINSYASIYASIANLKWSRELSLLKDGLVERVTLKSNSWAIDCLPNAEAAFVCKEAVAE